MRVRRTWTPNSPTVAFAWRTRAHNDNKPANQSKTHPRICFSLQEVGALTTCVTQGGQWQFADRSKCPSPGRSRSRWFCR